MPTKPKPKTVDAYLATVPADRHAALEAVRRAVHALVPMAEECVSYGMPAFRRGGVVFGGFRATAKGCSWYPFSGSTLKTLAKALAGYEGSPGALYFDPSVGLPRAVLRDLIRVRLAEAAAPKPRAKKASAMKASARKRP
jgi:uncharacterized protein YdhG (YjbR/CyaY superfamily)